jgi:hypothetical protein
MKTSFIPIFILLFCLHSNAQQRKPAFKHRKALCFIENKGQVSDQNGKYRNDILYTLSGNGITLFLAKGGLHYQFNKTLGSAGNSGYRPTPGKDSVEFYRLDVTLLNSNKAARVIPEEPTGYYENYCTDVCHATVHAFNKIVYKNVYPFIDWVIYLKAGKPEYDFIVRPGGNARDIQIQYNGAVSSQLLNGSFIVKTPLGQISEQAPYAYSLPGKTNMPAAFSLHNNILSFNVDNSDDTLVIDPQVVWGTYFGGSSTDAMNAIAADGSGNIVATGWTESNALATSGTYHTSYAAYIDVILAKFDTSGTRLWATYYGGRNNESGEGITCDDAANVYICGETQSDTGISTVGAYKRVYSGHAADDAFIAKFNSNGNIVWGTYYGSIKDDYAYAITYDGNSHIYITGYTLDLDSIATSGAYKTHRSDSDDAFLAKFNTSGSLAWGTYFGGSSIDRAYGVVCDVAGNVYIDGYTYSNDSITTPGAYQTAFGGGLYDGFLAKFNSAGTLKWSTYYGSDSEDVLLDIDYDKNSNDIFLTGTTNSHSNIATHGTFMDTLPVANDIKGMIVKFDTSGNRLWSSYFIGASQTISCDVAGCTYVAGETSDSTSGVSTTGGSFGGGYSDGFVYKFSPSGQRLWGIYLGGSNLDFLAASVAADKYLYISGSTYSTNNIATSGSFQPSLAGYSDGYIIKLNIDTTLVIGDPQPDTVICEGGTFNIHYLVNVNFNSGNVFTAQISDSTGSFAHPVSIGTNTSITSGNITCSIPSSVPLASGYRIRVAASNPYFAGSDQGRDITVVASLDTPKITTNSPLCINDTIKLSASTASAGAIIYSWTGPDGFAAIGKKQNVFPVSTAKSGIYTVSISAEGCPSYSANAVVNIDSVIPAKPTDSFTIPVCRSKPLYFFGKCSTPGVTYKWTGPGFMSTVQNPAITSAILGFTGRWVLTVSLGACRSSDTFNLTVNPIVTPSVNININPSGSISLGDTVTFTAITTGGGTSPAYQWRKNGSNIPGATSNPYITNNVTSGDVITVLFTSSEPCAIPDTALASTWPLGIAGVSLIQCRVYPDPANNFITVENAASDDYSISDVTGKILLSGKLIRNKQQIEISVLPNGIYLLQLLNSRGEKRVIKVFKQ